jgi:hypothetical protein
MSLRTLPIESIQEYLQEKRIFRSVSKEEIESALDELPDEYIVHSISEDDEPLICLNPNLVGDVNRYLEVYRSVRPIQKAILSYLKSFANTGLYTINLGAQKTKTHQMILKIKKFIELQDTTKKVIPIYISMNDLDLTDQTIQRFLKTLRVKVFVFGSRIIQVDEQYANMIRIIKTERDVDDVKNHISSYIHEDDHLMPLIIGLSNKTQINKMSLVLDWITGRRYHISYSILLDEADVTYPLARSSILKYICNTALLQEQGVYEKCDRNMGIYLATATGKSLEDTDLYPEIQFAEQCEINLEDSVDINYRDIAHTDAQFPRPNLKQRGHESNNEFILRIIRENPRHFTETIVKNEFSYKRRTIVLADVKNVEQRKLAESVIRYKQASIVVNQTGFTYCYPIQNKDGTLSSSGLISVTRRNHPELKRLPINEKITEIVNRICPELLRWGLLIIGNRKVDRAITYHNAPRDGSPAFLLTDCILGYGPGAAKSHQTLGRMFGVIAHCQEYCGKLWFWVDCRTREAVLRDVRINHLIEENSFAPEKIMYLRQKAEEEVPDEELVSGRDIREVGPFHTKEACFAELSRILNKDVKTSAFRPYTDKEDNGSTLGYEVSTRLNPHWGRYKSAIPSLADKLTSENRIILNRLGDDRFPCLLSEISKVVSVTANSGEKPAQNFVVLPVYENETTPSNDVQYIGRYEQPCIDKQNNVLFKNDTVLYKGIEYIIDEIKYSMDGTPTACSLKRNGEVFTNTDGDTLFIVEYDLQKS